MQTVQFECRKCKKVTKQVIHKITDLLPEGVETIQCSVCTFMTVATIGVDNEQLSTRVIHKGTKPVGLAQDQAQCLTGLLPSTLAGEPLKRLARWRSLVVLGVLCVIGMTPANGSQNNVDHLKIYAHVKLVSYKEFQCFNAIIHKESRWNYKARNHSHYGLGQMRSKHYGTLDPFAQIDRTIAYIKHRYETPCKAWEFHKVKGYYQWPVHQVTMDQRVNGVVSDHAYFKEINTHASNAVQRAQRLIT